MDNTDEDPLAFFDAYLEGDYDDITPEPTVISDEQMANISHDLDTAHLSYVTHGSPHKPLYLTAGYMACATIKKERKTVWCMGKEVSLPANIKGETLKAALVNLRGRLANEKANRTPLRRVLVNKELSADYRSSSLTTPIFRNGDADEVYLVNCKFSDTASKAVLQHLEGKDDEGDYRNKTPPTYFWTKKPPDDGKTSLAYLTNLQRCVKREDAYTDAILRRLQNVNNIKYDGKKSTRIVDTKAINIDSDTGKEIGPVTCCLVPGCNGTVVDVQGNVSNCKCTGKGYTDKQRVLMYLYGLTPSGKNAKGLEVPKDSGYFVGFKVKSERTTTRRMFLSTLAHAMNQISEIQATAQQREDRRNIGAGRYKLIAQQVKAMSPQERQELGVMLKSGASPDGDDPAMIKAYAMSLATAVSASFKYCDKCDMVYYCSAEEHATSTSHKAALANGMQQIFYKRLARLNQVNVNTEGNQDDPEYDDVE